MGAKYTSPHVNIFWFGNPINRLHLGQAIPTLPLLPTCYEHHELVRLSLGYLQGGRLGMDTPWIAVVLELDMRWSSHKGYVLGKPFVFLGYWVVACGGCRLRYHCIGWVADGVPKREGVHLNTRLSWWPRQSSSSLRCRWLYMYGRHWIGACVVT